MTAIIELQRDFFKENRKTLLTSKAFTVVLFRYPSGVEGIEVVNSRGRMVVLPYMGQMIWDLEFDGIDLKMKNMFTQPKKANRVIDTYGCFAFHSGLLSNGCPGEDDDHELHGEMACAEMDRAWLEVSETSIKVCGQTEYAKGFGHHYLASPSVEMFSEESFIEIGMNVLNRSGMEMPLQYMCHTNYAYLEQAELTQNIPNDAFILRESIPDHVKPTQKWIDYTKKLMQKEEPFTTLNKPDLYDPEIVFFADELNRFQDEAQFEMVSPDGTAFFTRFSTTGLKFATRWILHNADQQVAAFVLPATCRPEGFKAAEKAGTLLILGPGEEKSFKITTGKK